MGKKHARLQYEYLESQRGLVLVDKIGGNATITFREQRR
jgi:hypothetical protein